MPPSQLKSLKVSLREGGVIGPQEKKNKKRQATPRGGIQKVKSQRDAAIRGIRQHFNPFEIRPAKREKYEFSDKRIGTMEGRLEKQVVGRPGVTKGFGEENRRKTLLAEMHRRKKVGGIVDRRFGENNPAMTPEERGLERYLKERQRANNKGSMFDLEDAEEEEHLTHFGKSLSSNNQSQPDDFNETDVHSSDNSEFDGVTRKKPRLSDTDVPTGKVGMDSQEDEPFERFKTRKEVMEEVIAKSKLHKYERQQAKEDDDELRAELDKDLPGLFSMMRQLPSQVAPHRKPEAVNDPNVGMNPDRMALINGNIRSRAEKDYDERLRQMAMDQRAVPSVRTLTDEEKAQHEAHRLKDLEAKRIERMRGNVDEDENENVAQAQDLADSPELDMQYGDAFGLGHGLERRSEPSALEVEDEDEFVIDEDLLASGTNADLSLDEDDDDEPYQGDSSDGEDGEFVAEIIPKDDAANVESNEITASLAYTYCCPENHEEFLTITNEVIFEEVPTIVQRIRALYHPKLANDNKRKLGKFASVLVEHLSYIGNRADHPPFTVIQALIRHVHSLAKAFPEEVGRAFQAHILSFHTERASAPRPGDLIVFWAIGFIFPTSDHFHQVVTPAMLCMARYLCQKVPRTLNDLTMGSYMCSLCLHYQRLSKRFLPEVLNYLLGAISALVPGKIKRVPGASPHHDVAGSIHLRVCTELDTSDCPPIKFWDALSTKQLPDHHREGVKQALLKIQLSMIDILADLWAGTSAFCEVFDSFDLVLQSIAGSTISNQQKGSVKEQAFELSKKIRLLLENSASARKPLRLHNHRPLAIKTSIPKFEESYNPDKHYDPDRDRAEMSKLKAEHKQERKGALRELRKDANFIAREDLREKKETDAAYEKRQKRLIADIQGEEGRESKIYDHERRLRKGRR